MQLRDSIVIAAEASAVWPFVADPALQGNWNPKIVLVDRGARGPAQTGEQFQMKYRISGQEHPSRVKVLSSFPPHLIVFQHHLPGKKAEQMVVETYQISECEAGVRLDQIIDFTGAHLPWPLRLLFWFVAQFDRHGEASHLETLKQTLERPLAAG
jgi:hypothetical protein